MRRILKWAGIVVGSLLGLLIVAVAVLAISGGNKLNKQYDIQPEPVAISGETAVIERGQYLVSVSCVGCHGEDLSGTAFFDDPALGAVAASNLTAGQGGIGATYSDADYVRAIRHGVNSEGLPLMIMPANAFWHYSDEDLGAIIAYVKSVPPVDNDPGGKALKLMGRVLLGAGLFDVLSAESIDHAGPRPAVQPRLVNAAYGEYLTNINDCHLCHGPKLSGGQSPEPGSPPGPSLTPDSDLAGWRAEDFIATMRTGVRPDGRTLDPAVMPWQEYGRLNDDDLTALFLHLQSLPTAVSVEE